MLHVATNLSALSQSMETRMIRPKLVFKLALNFMERVIFYEMIPCNNVSSQLVALHTTIVRV